MLDDRSSRIALAASLLLHAALVAPVRDFVGVGNQEAFSEADEPMVFRFVDPQPVEAEPPEEPSDLSSTDARAAQPNAPPERPEGAAFSAGPAPAPTTPRSSGAPASGARGASEAEPLPEPVREAEDDDGPPSNASPAVDPRLALPMATPRLREPPGDGALPVPEVDQRLTQAAYDKEFSLNTTAWRWGPYMERLKRRVEEHISPPAAFYYGTAAWVTRVRFRIAPDGRLTSLQLLDHRGVDGLQYVATDALEGAADYEPLPPDFPEPYLEVTAHFYFNVVPER
ncbi:MAG: hypothetical protein KY397_00215 [Gemmatimonadetes bacterium]|nr:hypothetical protein [Gemmatimonadota bacterium]